VVPKGLVALKRRLPEWLDNALAGLFAALKLQGLLP
jgi:hypothetical protein